MNLHSVEINQAGLPRPMTETMDKMRSITPTSMTSEESSSPSRFSVVKPAKVMAQKMQEKKKRRKQKKNVQELSRYTKIRRKLSTSQQKDFASKT